MKFKTQVTSYIAFGLLAVSGAQASDPNVKPKYGPAGHPIAIPLRESNEYFRKPSNAAPQFWSLISFYVPQQTHSTCSIATTVMALNAALSEFPRTSEDSIIREKTLIQEIEKHKWEKLAREKASESRLGAVRYVASLDQFKYLLTEIFRNYHFDKVNVQAIHISDNAPKTKQELLKQLKLFSLSRNYFILANFNQQKYTNDADVGHYAPVGAYDEERERVLILDPDREYYEPYWVSVDDFLVGMKTVDSAVGKSRGYLWISLNSENQ